MKGSGRGLEREEGKIKDPDQEIEGTNKLVDKLVDKILQDNSIVSSPESKTHLEYWYVKWSGTHMASTLAVHIFKEVYLKIQLANCDQISRNLILMRSQKYIQWIPG